MKEIYTNELPRWKNGGNKNQINWKESVGYKVKGVYEGLEFEVEIVDYIKINNKNYLKIKYNNNIGNIISGHFLQCKLGNILGIYTEEYKYQIKDIITDVKSGKLEILEQTRMGKKNKKGYKYKCLMCGNENIISEGNLINNKQGCNVCSNQKVKIGYNDMWTTNPELAKLLADPDDGYKYVQNSITKVDWKCPICGNIIKNKKISNINNYKLSCPKCGDKLPYPEKFVYSIMQQLNIDFTYQLTKTTFKWCKDYRYDFYFKLNNEDYVIEVQGIQHYEESFSKYGGRNLKEEQENDRLKKELALNNSIKEENYIVIDCRESTLKWIKEHISNSNLNNIFDLSQIDWLQCHEYACSSLVKKACKLWSNGIHSTIKIGEILKLNCNTICRYLKQGSKLGWCNYNPKEVKKNIYKNLSNKYGGQNKQKVICLNNGKVFNSIIEASKIMNTNSSDIVACCQKRTKVSGQDILTKEKLQWQYYDEYLIKPKKLLTNKEINKLNNNCKKRKIICLNDKKIYNSMVEAIDYYNLKLGVHISECCKEERKYAGELNTGEYLQWQYYDKYLVNPKKLLSNEEIDILNKNSYIKHCRRVICLNNEKIFNSIKEAENFYNIKGISLCCQGKYNYAGKDPITGEKLKWMYYDDYIQNQKKEIS